MNRESASVGIHTSIIGIGIKFNSELTDEVTKNRGSNYMCITKGDDLQKTIVDEFHYNFLPITFDVNMTANCTNFDISDVYGTPFETEKKEASITQASWKTSLHRFYPSKFKIQYGIFYVFYIVIK